MSARDDGAWPHLVTLDPLGSGLALGRRMVRAGARVTHVSPPGHDWETRGRGIEHVVAPWDPDGEPWLEAVRQLAAESEQIVVVPASDRGSELLAKARDRVPPNVRAFELSGDAHLALMDKEQADAIARAAGVRVPWTKIVHSTEEFAAIAGEAPWPCVVKPIHSHLWRDRYGERRAFVVQDAQEAEAVLAQPLADGVGMLLCQYIPGGDDCVEEAIMIRLADGSYPMCFGCRKLRQSPRGTGATAVGVSDPLTETTALARAVLDEAGFVGVAGVEAKRHAETGESWFLEVNVRIPAQWGLGDASGAEASHRLVSALAGRPLGPAPVPRAGVGIVVPQLEVSALRETLSGIEPRRRPRELLTLMRPYLSAREVGILDLRDPGPGLAWARLVVGRRVGRVTERLRR